VNDYLTPGDLAERWSVSVDAVYMRKYRGNLPEPDQVLSKVPLWKLATIEEYERGKDGN